MATLAPQFSVSRLDDRRIIYIVAAGLFTRETLAAFQAELLEVSRPFRNDGVGFRVLNDFRDLCVQHRDITDGMRLTQDISAAVGVTHMATVYSSVLVKQQMRRVSKSLNHKTCDTIDEALAWLKN